MRLKDIISSFFKYIFFSIFGAIFSIFAIGYDIYSKYSNEKKINIFLIFIVGAFLIFFIENLYFYFRNKSFKRKYNYYRNFPNDYSPSLVSLLLNLNIEYKKDILSDLIFLEQKGLIRLDNNKNIFITNSNYEWKAHEEHLKLLMNQIINMYNPTIDKFLEIKQKRKVNKITKYLHYFSSRKYDYNMYGSSEGVNFADEYIDAITVSAYRKGLLTKLSLGTSYVLFGYIIKYIFPIVILVISFFIHNIEIINLIFVLFLSMLILYILALSYRGICGMDNVRTKKGKKEVALWQSFISFLKDFSNLEFRDLDEKTLWEYYYAYALALGINKKVIKKLGLEYEKYII